MKVIHSNPETGEVKIVERITQGHIEDYEWELRNLGVPIGDEPVHVAFGDFLRCAIRANWVEGIQVDDVREMDPRDVQSLAETVAEIYYDATTLPKG